MDVVRKIGSNKFLIVKKFPSQHQWKCMENNVRRMLADIGQLLDVAEYDTKNYADREGG